MSFRCSDEPKSLHVKPHPPSVVLTTRLTFLRKLELIRHALE
ncbi:hypothetical protein HMPREF9374_2274, partial [Desmospora sp. 8437]